MVERLRQAVPPPRTPRSLRKHVMHNVQTRKAQHHDRGVRVPADDGRSGKFPRAGALMNLGAHPTVRRYHASADKHSAPPSIVDAAWLRQLCLHCGADDAGLLELSRPAVDDQRADILRYFPPT